MQTNEVPPIVGKNGSSLGAGKCKHDRILLAFLSRFLNR